MTAFNYQQCNFLIMTSLNFSNFIQALHNLTDTRDNRGKRHTYVFIITAVVIAIMKGKSRLSSICRYIKHNMDFLKEVTNMHAAKHISRAHLPRFLSKLIWADINDLIECHFNIRINADIKNHWTAIDGKAIKGTIAGGNQQSIIHAVIHGTREEIAQARQSGKKSSEITVVRKMLKDTGLEKGNITLDALHCNPTTTSQINKAEGSYLIQVKENQPELLDECKRIHKEEIPVGNDTEVDKGHGRLTTRKGSNFNINPKAIDKRWKDSQLKTLVVIERSTFNFSTDKECHEISYYINNKSVDSTELQTSKNLIKAVKEHWGVESNNWILDSTFDEDKIKIKSGNQAQIIGRLRGLCADLIRRSGASNIKAAIERYADSNQFLVKLLKQVKFL